MFYGMKKKNAGNKPPQGKLTAPVRSQKPKIRKKSMDKEVRTLMQNSGAKNATSAYKTNSYPTSGNGMP